MSITGCRRIVAAILVLLTTGEPGVAATDRHGLLLYLERDDRRAFGALRRELDDPPLDPRAVLALGDLAFMHRDFATARQALDLVVTLGAEPFARRARVWLAWIEFESGHHRAAEERLRRVVAEEPGALGDEAALALGWQQLISDRPHDAARTFAALGDARTGHWVAFPDDALLLEGQARLFAGDLAGAEGALGRLAVLYPSSRLRDDAERDRAWIRHLHGDDAGASADLEALIARYDGPHFTGDDAPGLPAWSTVLARGPGTLAAATRRAYRRRPRGEPPLPFLLRIVNRAAVRDARDLLELLANGQPVVAPNASRRPRHDRRAVGEAGSRPPAAAGTDAGRPAGVQGRSSATSHRQRRLAIGLALLVLLLVARTATRARRRRPR